MILSTYERKDSPWVWVQFARNPDEKKRAEKTTVRKSDPQKRRKIAKFLVDFEARLADEFAGLAPVDNAAWRWVADWLAVRFKGRTLEVYRAHWRSLAEFLAGQDITDPRLITREDCYAYVPWRTRQTKEKSGRHPKRNTAVGELKLLGQVLEEAKRRHLLTENVARKLGIERDEIAEKPAITDAELAIIFPALANRPDWMRRAFGLALVTGLRFSDTELHRRQMDWALRVIQVEKPKGGRKKAFAIPIYERAEPLLREWQQEGSDWFWTLPPKERKLTGLAWTKFFREIGLPHLCFHCTRVTFITRGALAGIPEGTMMKLVNHASKEVHRVYQRLPHADAARLVDSVPMPCPAGAMPHSPSRTRSRRD